MMQNKFIFGITGPSGSGKTTVSDIFRELGAVVIDCDIIARQVTEIGEPCLEELSQAFGNIILDETGALKRRKLADIVFSDGEKLANLNCITHKYIKNRIMYEICEAECDIIGIDGAVILGSPVEELCQAMVCIVADEKMRLNRIQLRDNLDDSSAERRLSSQKNNDFYIEKADYIVYNNTTQAELEKSVMEVWEQLLRRKEKIKMDV